MLVAVLIVAIALAALLLYMLSLRAAMLAALRQIAVLTLLYYRLQQIPTCVKAPNTTGDEEWFHWFFDWVEKGGTTGGG